jgi:pimeloyl-ACP methyl ester carboxylesterase
MAANLLASTIGQPDDLLDGLAGRHAPMLIYCGELDGASSEKEIAAARLPEAAFVTLDKMNHIEAFLHSEAILPQARAFLMGT